MTPLLDGGNGMRGSLKLMGALLLLVCNGCAPWPTGKEINDSLERSLRSVSGEWRGQSFSETPVSLEFRLQEDGTGKVTGTGTMKESRTGCAWPISVSGTYRRPLLALTISGRRCEGEEVKGTLQGEYTTVGGIASTLQLIGDDTAEAVSILLHED